ncbi:MAG: hypothetical protein R3350_06860 [Saprospiraceae bacterium]|nr:hypothetical protein [Saprospiraceae bacterium]
MAKKKHRGRFQAQGGGLEESETWSQDEPLSKEEGFSLLDRLKEKLHSKDRELRKRQFEDAKRFIKGAKGGIDAPERKSFRNRKTKDIRVDIEVWSGRAFISIIFLILLLLWLLK